MSRRRTAGSLLSVAVALSLVVSAHVPGLMRPTVSLDPASGPPGSSVTVSGTGFERHCPVDVFVGSTAADPVASEVPVSKAGTFSTSITIPTDLEPGPLEVVARGEAKRKNGNCQRPTPTQASATYTVEEQILVAYDRNIHLSQRTIEDPGIDDGFLAEITAGSRAVHGIVQLHTLPKAGDIELLRSNGVVLLDYLSGDDADGTAYFASIGPDVAADREEFRNIVRGVQRIEPVDKMGRGLDEATAPADVIILFFRDVEPDLAAESLGEARVEERTNLGDVRTFQATLTPAQVDLLTHDDRVQWIEERHGADPYMDELRVIHGVDTAQGFGLDPTTGMAHYSGLSGNGVQLAVMDSGVDDAHADLADRLIHDADPLDSHGTAVAGVAAGSGVQSDKLDAQGAPNGGAPFQWRGVAPEAEVAAYRGRENAPAAGADHVIMREAINELGVDVSNHSYGWEDYGRYTSTARSFDEIIRGGVFNAGTEDQFELPPRPAVHAAGNNTTVGEVIDCDGDGVKEAFPQYPDPITYFNATGKCPVFQAGYFSILSPCKNCISVAAVDKDLIHAPYSSLGPTLDGRIGIDVAAVGHPLTTTSLGTDGYGTFGGTSMAAPAVTGVVALMTEEHELSLEDEDDFVPFLPSTVKAILIQSALDLNDTDPTTNFDTNSAVEYGSGPDFATGYGLVNADAAVRIVRDRAFRVDAVSVDVPSKTHDVTVKPGQKELRLTLAWDDLPSSPNLNGSAKTLVNDLDLSLRGPDDSLHRPLVLPILRPRDCDPVLRGVQTGTCIGQDDPTLDYDGPAAPGFDRRNNVEQIVVKDPQPGVWRARVSAYNPDRRLRLPLGSPPDVRLPLGGPQEYSLAIGAGTEADLRIVASSQPDPALSGGTVFFDIDVTNDGPGTALSTDVRFTPAPEMAFVSDSMGICGQTAGVIACHLGHVPAGAQRSIKLTMSVEPDLVYDAGHDLLVGAQAAVSSATPDPDSTDNVANVATEIVGRTELEVITAFATGTATQLAAGKPTIVTVETEVANFGLSTADIDVSTSLSGTGFNVVSPHVNEGLQGVPPGDVRRVIAQFAVTCPTAGTTGSIIAEGVAEVAPPIIDIEPANNLSSVTHAFSCVKKAKSK